MPLQECPQAGFIDKQNIKVNQELESFDDSLETHQFLSTRIEWSQMLADINECRACGGMVVDLATGKFYCGNAAPEKIIENNQRILAS